MQWPSQLLLLEDARAPDPVPAAIRLNKRIRAHFIPREKETSRYANLVLASASPSKINVLQLLGLQFAVDPANIDERSFTAKNPQDLVRKLAMEKATAINLRHKNCLLLGADTLIVDLDGPIGKPDDRLMAHVILKRLSGMTHSVITGLTLIDQTTNQTVQKLAVTNVIFRDLSDETINRYLATGEPYGKAGGYALQGIGALLVKSVDGEYSNVLGLPIATFVEALSELGYELI